MKLSAVFLLVFSMMALTSGLIFSICNPFFVHISKPCPRGWRKITSHCFRYVAKPMTWADAEKNCLSIGAHLASIHKMEDYSEVQKLIRDRTGTSGPAWLGGSDVEQEGTWLWSDECPLRFTRWCRGEPNDAGYSQHCLQMNWTDEKCWDDFSCSRRLPSVCAKNLLKM